MPVPYLLTYEHILFLAATWAFFVAVLAVRMLLQMAQREIAKLSQKSIYDMVRDKRLAIGLVVLLGILFGCLVAYFFAIPSERPIIQLSQTEVNFGEIAAGTKAERTITIRNVGTANLVINEVKSGCGSVHIRLSQDVIAPGETAQLHLAMDATEYGQRTDIYLFFNDPKPRAAVVSVSAEAAMQTLVKPSIIDFGQIVDLEGLPASKEVNILINSDMFFSDDADIIFSTSHAYLKIDRSKPAVGRSQPVVLTLPSDTPIGDIFTELQIQSHSQTVSIRVIGTVRGQFYALPPMLLFNQVSQNDDVIFKTVEIRSRFQNGIEDIPTIDSFELCNFLKPLMTASLSGENKVTLTFAPSNPHVFWAPSTTIGALSIKCSSAHFTSKNISVPIQITLRVPKIVGK